MLWTVLAAVALVLAGSTAVVLTRDPTTGPVSDAGPAHDAGLVTASPAPAASRTGASDTPTPATPTPSESPADPPVGDPPTARGEPPVPQEEPSDPMPTREPDPGRGGQRSGPGESLLALEQEVVTLTNAERTAAGCAPLEWDDRLHQAAREHSTDMATHNYFSHTGRDGRSPFDRMRDAGYPNPAAENIAMGYQTPAQVVEGWMNSDGHRRNILNCQYRTIGVGLAYDERGRPYWTQVFGR